MPLSRVVAKAGLFDKWLKVSHRSCNACGEELLHERAQDFPPYITISIVGHIVVTLCVDGGSQFCAVHDHPSADLGAARYWCLPLALMQPVKGGVVGMQWALRMFGFDGKGRRMTSHAAHPGCPSDEMERAAVLDGSRRSPNMPPEDASRL